MLMLSVRNVLAVLTLSVLLLLTPFSPYIAQSSAVPTTFGPVNESCDTTDTIPGAIVLSANPNRSPFTPEWEGIIEGEVNVPGRGRRIRPGDIILLRGGSYLPQTRDRRADNRGQAFLSPISGRAGNPITLKSFNCERVTIRQGGLAPNSFNIIAGIRVRYNPIHRTCPQPNFRTQTTRCHAVLLEPSSGGVLTQVTLRNNDLIGGGNPIPKLPSDIRDPDAGQGRGVFIKGNVRDVVILGNLINASGLAGQTILFEGDANDPDDRPRDVTIAQNRIEKNAINADEVGSDDLVEISNVGPGIVIEENLLTNAFNIEQAIDIKGQATASIKIIGNLFDGDSLFQGDIGGEGCFECDDEDIRPDCKMRKSGIQTICGPCMLIGNDENVAPPPVIPRHEIIGNTFVNCEQGFGINTSPNRMSKLFIADNVFLHDDKTNLEDAEMNLLPGFF